MRTLLALWESVDHLGRLIRARSSLRRYRTLRGREEQTRGLASRRQLEGEEGSGGSNGLPRPQNLRAAGAACAGLEVTTLFTVAAIPCSPCYDGIESLKLRQRRSKSEPIE